MKEDKTRYGVTCLIHNCPNAGGDGLGSYCPVCYDEDSKFKEFVDNFRQVSYTKATKQSN